MRFTPSRGIFAMFIGLHLLLLRQRHFLQMASEVPSCPSSPWEQTFQPQQEDLFLLSYSQST